MKRDSLDKMATQEETNRSMTDTGQAELGVITLDSNHCLVATCYSASNYDVTYPRLLSQPTMPTTDDPEPGTTAWKGHHATLRRFEKPYHQSYDFTKRGDVKSRNRYLTDIHAQSVPFTAAESVEVMRWAILKGDDLDWDLQDQEVAQSVIAAAYGYLYDCNQVAHDWSVQNFDMHQQDGHSYMRVAHITHLPLQSWV